MPKLQLQNGRYSLTVPFEMVQSKGWKKHQTLLFVFNAQGNIEIQELKKEGK